jgi:hypothetical protein
MDEFYDFAAARTAFDGEYYEQPPKPMGVEEKQELRATWEQFSQLRDRIEAIADTAPSLTKLWSRDAKPQQPR